MKRVALSEHFYRDEFACKCGCGFDSVDSELIDILQDLRWYLDLPVRILSGCRCEAHNIAIGGSPNSQHLIARAADVYVNGVPPSTIQKWAIDSGAQGVGSYDGFTHIDTRSGPYARWSK